VLRLDECYRCPQCSGDLQALSVCPPCRTTTVVDPLIRVEPEIACARCGSPNPTRFVCIGIPPSGPELEDSPILTCSPWFTYEEVAQPIHLPITADALPEIPVQPAPVAQLALEGRDPQANRALSRRRGLLSPSPSWPVLGVSNRGPVDRPRSRRGRVNGAGRVNGLINGTGPANATGRVNGLANGLGVLNGSGRVNGLALGRGAPHATGRVNGLANGRVLGGGNGRVNGLGTSVDHGDANPPGRVRSGLRRLGLRHLALAAAFLMVTVILFGLFTPTRLTPGISIDGSFEDWRAVPSYLDGTQGANPNVRIRSVALKHVESSVYFRVELAGTAFADPVDYDTIHGFFDVDGNHTTGYDLGDLGADYLARISGSQGLVNQAVLLRFEGDNPEDWNGWRSVQGLPAASNGPGLEAEIPALLLEGFAPDSFRARFASDDNAGETSHTLVPVGLALGALRVSQKVIATTLDRGSQPFLSLQFEAIGSGARILIHRVELQTSAGAAFDAIPEDFEVSEGSPVTRVVAVDPLTLPEGSVVSAGVAGVATDRPFSVLGLEARAHVLSAPDDGVKRIDGLFTDWTNPSLDEAGSLVHRPSMDIMGWDASSSEDTVFLYARLSGEVLEGSLVPERFVRPPADGGPAAGTSEARSPPPRIGRDYIRFYLSTESGGDGIRLGGRSFDRFVDVQGRGGRVENASAYRWSGEGWEWEAPVATGLGGKEIEAGALIGAGAIDAHRTVVVTADWSGIADATEAEEPKGSRGSPGLIPLDGQNALTALAKPLTNTPTVDGNCGTISTEYDGADLQSNANLKFFVGRRSGTSRLHVCLEVTADTTDDGVFDSGRLVFDRNHDGGSAPQSDDRRFRVTSGGALTSEKGNGAGWVSCGGSCYSPSGVGAFNNSRQVYEFSASFWDVWGTNSTTANQVAGFAVLAFDDTTFNTYTWGSDNVNQNNPGTWGHIQIPEFSSALVGASLVLAVVLVRRRRPGRGRAHEMPVSGFGGAGGARRSPEERR